MCYNFVYQAWQKREKPFREPSASDFINDTIFEVGDEFYV